MFGERKSREVNKKAAFIRPANKTNFQPKIEATKRIRFNMLCITLDHKLIFKNMKSIYLLEKSGLLWAQQLE